MPHLLVDVSHHGYGHISQTAPVVNALAKIIPSLRVTLRTTAPLAILRQRFECDFQHLSLAFDFGMTMANAVDVLVEESAANYRNFHADWEEKVQREAQAMQALAPDLLFANIPYLSLAAAQRAGVPSVGMCSLDWADIYQHYCMRDETSQKIYAQMVAAYNSAQYFLQPQPSMAMFNFKNTRSIGPIAKVAKNKRAKINAQLPPAKTERLVLVAMGGMEFRLPMEVWPHIDGVRWLVPAEWGITREDVSAFDKFGLTFSEVLASCDAVLTKPGYGTFTEAACAGVPVLYVARHDWPEEPFLVAWMLQYSVCLEVSRAELEAGNLDKLLQQLWAKAKPLIPQATGAHEAAAYLAGLLPS
ncbi:MAG: hypothetical protein WCI39_08115 [Gallionellaceae bacterium]